MVTEKIQVITGTERRRRYSVEEKAEIVTAALTPGANVSELARRHRISPNMIYSWKQKFLAASQTPFAQVSVCDNQDAGETIKIHFNEKLLIEMPLSISATQLGAVIRSLRE